MRFIAALLVFATHVTFYLVLVGGALGDGMRKIFSLSGPYGVGFFFILSGFVLTWTARPGDTAPGFWRRRLVKIYPNHLVTCMLVAGMMTAGGAAIFPVPWLPNLFLLQSWVPIQDVSLSLNGPSWSLSCEAFFYLAFPLLFSVIRRIREERLWPAIGTVVALMVSAVLVARFLIPGEPLISNLPGAESNSFAQLWFVYLFPPVRALDFVLGMLLARIVLAGRWPAVGLPQAVSIALAGFVMAPFLPYLIGTGGLLAMWTAPLIAAAATADWRGRPSLFRGRVLVRLGERSFAFYLVHGIVVFVGALIIGPDRTFHPLAALAVVCALLTVSLLLSWVLYRCVEHPLVRRFSRPRALRQPDLQSAPAGT